MSQEVPKSNLDRASSREHEGQSRVRAQFVFLPHEHDPHYVLGLQAVAEEFFVPKPSVDNIVVIQTSIKYGGINLPHFQEWVEKEGSYFNGYLQHAATGNGNPLTPAEIASEREMFEEVYQADFNADWGDSGNDSELEKMRKKEQIFALSALYTLEKIPPEYNVQLAIQPFSGRELLRLLVKNKSLLTEQPDFEERKYTNLAEILFDARTSIHADMQATASLWGNRTHAFDTFLQTTIDQAQASGKETRLLIPMDEVGKYTILPNIERVYAGNSNIAFEDAYFINIGNYYPDPELSVVAKYIDNSEYEMTHEDLIKVLAARVFKTALEAMPNNWYTMRGHMMPTVIGRSTIAELEEVIKMTIAEEKPEEPLEENRPNDFLKLISEDITSPIRRIVDYYCDKAGPLFSYDPMEP
jgi:hypothetical protein